MIHMSITSYRLPVTASQWTKTHEYVTQKSDSQNICEGSLRDAEVCGLAAHDEIEF